MPLFPGHKNNYNSVALFPTIIVYIIYFRACHALFVYTWRCRHTVFTVLCLKRWIVIGSVINYRVEACVLWKAFVRAAMNSIYGKRPLHFHTWNLYKRALVLFFLCHPEYSLISFCFCKREQNQPSKCLKCYFECTVLFVIFNDICRGCQLPPLIYSDRYYSLIGCKITFFV